MLNRLVEESRRIYRGRRRCWLICWILVKRLLTKISADFREIGDGDALDQRQRAEMLATIDADRLLIERSEYACIWAAAERGETIDFRATTSPHRLSAFCFGPYSVRPTDPHRRSMPSIVQPGGGRR